MLQGPEVLQTWAEGYDAAIASGNSTRAMASVR